MSATVKMTDSSGTAVPGKHATDVGKGGEEQDPGVPKPAAEWSVGFCQCCQYTSPETGKCVAFPLLCPQACCCPALILGANTSLLKQEKPIYIGEDDPERDCTSCLGGETYWKLGEEGNKVCLNTCLLQSLCYALCAGLPVVSLLVHKQRKEIMLKYNMPPVSRMAAVVAACLYPCALFQQHAHLETHHYSHHAPGFRASASGNGLTSVGPLRRGATSKAFRSSTAASAAGQPPEDVDMKRDDAPANRPSALQIPDDFLFCAEATPQPPSTHDSHHTIPANPPATPSPAATPSGLHRSHTRSASTSHNSALAPDPPTTNPYTGWPLDDPHPRSAPSTRASSIELSGFSHPTSPTDPDPPRTSSLWNAPTRPNPWAAPPPLEDPPSAAPAPFLTNPFATTPGSSTSALSPTWQTPTPSPTTSTSSTVQPLPWRPTRPPPPRPPTAGMSADSDMVLMGATSMSQSLPPLARTSQERRTSDPYPPMQPDKFKSYKPDPMDLSSLVALSSPTASASSARPSPMDPSPAGLPDSIMRPSASLSGPPGLRSKRYDNLMASIPDSGR